MSENREPASDVDRNVTDMHRLDPRVCYRALQTHDERFDGRLFVGVTSTGIYCRPVCPARTARIENCRFFASAAAAQEAGFRPCLRCRPETAPDLGTWRGTENTVTRGLALIAAGALDGDDASVDNLAERLGVGARQLRRLFQQHLGASPQTVAQTRRVLFAKRLIHETRLPMAEIALASGFGSVRRFNETFQQLYRRPPSALRRRGVVALPEGTVAGSGVTVRVRYRAPYDWAAMLAHLRARAVEGVEQVDGDTYRRTVCEDGETGTVAVAHVPGKQSLAVTVRFPNLRALPAIIARVRHLFDVSADVTAIGAHLARDPLLAPLVSERPGLRVPGGWDGFEIAARAILGQQVTVEAGRQLAGALARACGRPVAPAQGGDAFLSRCFPSAADVARAAPAALEAVPGPAARRRALAGVAQAAVADPMLFQPQGTIDETAARLQALPGVGEWTAHYIALRAGRDPDAFPATDVGLLRAWDRIGDTPAARTRATSAARSTKPRQRAKTDTHSTLMSERAARWRPWRGYAAQHLWTAEAARSAQGGSP
jgi:AraC family transcriptional regulator, regulatory protein of adaptative response / DNA-3-methyladenine glycosylase II